MKIKKKKNNKKLSSIRIYENDKALIIALFGSVQKLVDLTIEKLKKSTN